MALRTKKLMINRNVLVKTFKRFKEEPNKVFVASDLVDARRREFRERYLQTLILFGLIEEVETYYECGHLKKSRRRVRGYKFKNNNPILNPRKLNEMEITPIKTR